jgi:hypothetical protein
MSKTFSGEALFYTIAALLYGWFLADANGRIDWTSYSVFLPTALLALVASNYWLRSKVLAWGIFTIGFLCFMAVMGACILNVRTKPDVLWIVFMRAMGLYLCLSIAAFYQLRVSRIEPSEKETPK